MWKEPTPILIYEKCFVRNIWKIAENLEHFLQINIFLLSCKKVFFCIETKEY